MSKKGNNATRRMMQIESTYKKKDGKEIKPIYYYGKMVGNGNYFAGTIGDNLICNSENIPIPYRNIVGDK